MAVTLNWNIPNNTKSGKVAVVYARYSSHSQGEQSIEGQLAEAHKYAAAQGYTIVHEYIDRAKSGRTDNREQFQQMLKDTGKKQFDVIIVWKVDRFGRNREEISYNKYRCKKNNVRVEYVAEKIPNTPEGVILESVLEGFAEYYSLQLAQNIRRGLNESAAKCQSVGGNRPLGYLTGPDKKFVIDPVNAPTVQMIFRMYAEGYTISEITDHLNSLGLRTLKGKPFTKNSVPTILKNEKYTGVYIYGDVRVEGGIPRLIDDETFQKVQEMLKINRRAPAHKWTRADYILTDKLFCGHCGGQMAGECGTSRSGTVYNYYLCTNHKRKKGCKKKAVRQDWIEPFALNEIRKLLDDDAKLNLIADLVWDYYQAQDESRTEIDKLEKELAQTETAISNLMRAIEMGILNDTTKRRMDELNQQQKELQAAIAEREIAKGFHLTREHILFFFRQFRNGDWNDREFQKRVIGTFVNSIYVYDDKIILNFNYSGEGSKVTLEQVDTAWGAAENAGGNVFERCAALSTITRTYEHPLVVFANVFSIVIEIAER